MVRMDGIRLSASELTEQSGDVTATTARIQAAIDAAGERGGGVVAIPPGEWTIRTIYLRSGITLRLERGAVLRADTNLEAYPTHGRGHNKDRQPYHLIHAENCHGITIEGDGTIDGQGPAFWHAPPEMQPYFRPKGPRISPLIELRWCRDVVLRDFVIRESPGWTIHPFCCDQVTIRGVTIDGHLYGPNNDGIDINGCRDVFISDCRISGCDDNIIIKATDDARSSERIVVTNCILESNCAALGLGAETSSGIRDVAFSNCVIKRALRMIQIEMWESGTIENIVFSNITGNTMTDVPLERPIYIDIQQHRRPDGCELGKIRNVLISNFSATTRGRVMLTAQDGAVIENVTLRDIHLRYPEIEDPQETVPPSRSSQMSNYSPHSRAVRSAVVADNVKGLQLHNVVTTWPEDAKVPMHGLWCRNVSQSLIDAPYLGPSRTGVSAVELNGSTPTVRAVDVQK